MAVAEAIGQRSRCTRAKVGTVIVDQDNRLVATGYAGPPANMFVDTDDCHDWCPRAMAASDPHGAYEDCISTHSEMNALLFAGKYEMMGGTLYCTGAICYSCAKVIANSGVERVVMRVSDSDLHRLPERTVQYLRESLVQVDVVT